MDKTDDTGPILTIRPDARRKHMAVFGISGVGKNTFVRKMIA